MKVKDQLEWTLMQSNKMSSPRFLVINPTLWKKYCEELKQPESQLKFEWIRVLRSEDLPEWEYYFLD